MSMLPTRRVSLGPREHEDDEDEDEDLGTGAYDD